MEDPVVEPVVEPDADPLEVEDPDADAVPATISNSSDCAYIVLSSVELFTRFTRYVPPTLYPPEGGLMDVDVAEVASTKSESTWLFVGMTERSVLVRTTVKLVGSVSTRTQESVLVSVEDHEEVLLG